jgi:hypothetical protein
MRKSLISILIVGTAVFLLTGCEGETANKLPVAIAFGTPPSGLYEMHIGVDFGMTRTEGPRLSRVGSLMWDEWIEDHFELLDSAGQRVRLSRANNSRLMPASKLPGTFEFYLSAPIQQEAAYQLTYTPRREELRKYRHKFIAPVGQKDPLREWFTAVEPGE